MKFDWATHYFGWTYFRFEPWHWPPAAVHGYNAPIGTAIGLTDSLPLMAYLLKPFSRWLPAEFQYLGAWERLCFTLQGALAARLAGRFTPTSCRASSPPRSSFRCRCCWARRACGAVRALADPLVPADRDPSRAGDVPVGGVGRARPLSGLIQPYLAAMVAGLSPPPPSPGTPTAGGAGRGASAAASMLGGWWLSGMFHLGGTDGLAASAVGVFSTNLLGADLALRLVSPDARVAPGTPGSCSRASTTTAPASCC